jgi:tRNA pseudouridine55 synthase
MMDAAANRVAGLLNLNKPTGKSTAKYVYRLRPILGIRKVGHAGTLDPFADGVVIACVGRATKLVERLMALPKSYRTTLHLGVTNQTYDPEQPFEPVPGARPQPREEVERVLAGFLGEIEQVPPAYSAVKIGGIPSYRLAREGRAAPRKPKRIRIHELTIIEYHWPMLGLEVRCGRGTYIRGLARDLGRRLGCGACCQTLTRTAIGPFRIEDAVSLDGAASSAIWAALLPITEAGRLLEDVETRRLSSEGEST